MSSQQINLERHGMVTVLDKEVALASAAQGLAPAGAMPPLMVGMLAPKLTGEMYVGAPVMPGNHARASAVRTKVQQTPEADAFAKQEIHRRMQLGGFYDHGRMHGKNQFDMMQIAAISGDHMPHLGESAWAIHDPQVPTSMNGLKGRSSEGGAEMQRKPRWQRGSVFTRDGAEQPILRPNHAKSPAPLVAAPRVTTTGSAAGGKSMLSRGHA
jgi:hypothetical protein